MPAQWWMCDGSIWDTPKWIEHNKICDPFIYGFSFHYYTSMCATCLCEFGTRVCRTAQLKCPFIYCKHQHNFWWWNSTINVRCVYACVRACAYVRAMKWVGWKFILFYLMCDVKVMHENFGVFKLWGYLWEVLRENQFQPASQPANKQTNKRTNEEKRCDVSILISVDKSKRGLYLFIHL